MNASLSGWCAARSSCLDGRVSSGSSRRLSTWEQRRRFPTPSTLESSRTTTCRTTAIHQQPTEPTKINLLYYREQRHNPQVLGQPRTHQRLLAAHGKWCTRTGWYIHLSKYHGALVKNLLAVDTTRCRPSHRWVPCARPSWPSPSGSPPPGPATLLDRQDRMELTDSSQSRVPRLARASTSGGPKLMRVPNGQPRATPEQYILGAPGARWTHLSAQ